MSVDTGVLEAQTVRMATGAIARPRTKKAEAAPRPGVKGRLKTLETKAFSEAKTVPGVSIFAIAGTIIVSVLMVFVVLAQINYNETANESVRLSAHVQELTQQHRALEFAFESSFDIKEIERIAKDELGMSRPDSSQIITINAAPHDTATVIIGEEESGMRGFADFIKSLTDYFKN